MNGCWPQTPPAHARFGFRNPDTCYWSSIRIFVPYLRKCGFWDGRTQLMFLQGKGKMGWIGLKKWTAASRSFLFVISCTLHTAVKPDPWARQSHNWNCFKLAQFWVKPVSKWTLLHLIHLNPVGRKRSSQIMNRVSALAVYSCVFEPKCAPDVHISRKCFLTLCTAQLCQFHSFAYTWHYSLSPNFAESRSQNPQNM